eukprot:6163792-Prymnesium_polylepis.1
MAPAGWSRRRRHVGGVLHVERLARSDSGFFGGMAALGRRAAEQEPSAAVRASSPELVLGSGARWFHASAP